MLSRHNAKKISIDRKKTKSPQDMPQMHAHENHEIYFLLSGARRYFIKDTIYDVSANDIIVIPKNELHRTVTYNESGYDRYVVYFPDMLTDAVRISAGNDNFENFLGCGCIQLSRPHAEKFKELLGEMEYESGLSDRHTPLMLSNKLNELIVYAMRYGSPKEISPDKNAERIQTVAHFVTENFASPITLHDAARMAYLEEAYFCKQFKKLTGFGFVEYLTQVRVKAAASLLSDSDIPISKIAEKCGFTSGNYFGDVFKRFYGVSPREYRNTTKI